VSTQGERGLERYGQSFSSVPDRIVSEDWYGQTPDGPLLPKGITRPRRSSPRLGSFEYTGPYAYYLTLNTDAGRAYFREDRFIRFCMNVVNEKAAANSFELLAYCFMPNHVHLLVKGLAESSRLKPFIQQFKQVTGFAFKTDHRRPLWHRSFHDHVARAEEDLHAVAAYIWNNPAKAGIVKRIEEYPYSGPRERLVPSEGPSMARSVGVDRDVGGQSLSSVRTSLLPPSGDERPT
jgi:putative transposase